MALTGQLEIGRINTQPQRLFAFSWAFWVLLITSAYTANLANFFVTKSANIFQVDTIAHAVQLGMSICVWENTGTHYNIQERFPHARLVPSDSLAGVFQRLKDDKCDILASEISTWMVQRQNIEAHGDCELFWNGIVQLGVKGGIAMTVDSVCSIKISETVDLHMREMVQDGTTAAIWEKYAILIALFSYFVAFLCLFLMNGLAFPSPPIRYVNRFHDHTCPDHEPIPLTGWAGTSSASADANPVGLREEKSLRFLISILFPYEGKSSHNMFCFCCMQTC
jgi:hypothetical protein